MNNYHITINSKRKPLYSTHSQKGPPGDVQFNITNMTTKQTRRSQRICQMYGELRQLCPTNTGIFTIQNNWGECEKLCWNCKGLIQKVRGHVLNITQQSTLGVTHAKNRKTHATRQSQFIQLTSQTILIQTGQYTCKKYTEGLMYKTWHHHDIVFVTY